MIVNSGGGGGKKGGGNGNAAAARRGGSSTKGRGYSSSSSSNPSNSSSSATITSASLRAPAPSRRNVIARDNATCAFLLLLVFWRGFLSVFFEREKASDVEREGDITHFFYFSFILPLVLFLSI